MSMRLPDTTKAVARRPGLWERRVTGRNVEAVTTTGETVRGRVVEVTAFEIALETAAGTVILHKGSVPVVRVK